MMQRVIRSRLAVAAASVIVTAAVVGGAASATTPSTSKPSSAYSAAIVTITSAGCPAGQYHGAISQAGAHLHWTTSDCRSYLRPSDIIVDAVLHARVGQLPPNATFSVTEDALQPTMVSGTGPNNDWLDCRAAMQGDGLTSAAAVAISVSCRVHAGTSGRGTSEGLATALESGISSSPFVISQP